MLFLVLLCCCDAGLSLWCFVVLWLRCAVVLLCVVLLFCRCDVLLCCCIAMLLMRVTVVSYVVYVALAVWSVVCCFVGR